MNSQLDHLIVAAQTLSQGVQWCEETFGITPTAGGEHDKFGTHNRLFKIATPKYPMAYLEIIAINPAAPLPKSQKNKRWFDLDDPRIQRAIAKTPRLIHMVANTTDIQADRQALREQQIERGSVIHASRKTNKGRLQWQITVREDGERLFDGTLASLIQWGKEDAAEPLRLHPRNTLPRSGVSLQSLHITHPSAAKLQKAYDTLGLQQVVIQEGAANLCATFNSPKGLVQLESLGL